MRKHYDGLKAERIHLTENVMTGSNCLAMIQLQMVDGVCVSPDYQQQIEYVGDQG